MQKIVGGRPFVGRLFSMTGNRRQRIRAVLRAVPALTVRVVVAGLWLPAASADIGFVNVRDHGARGDGETDDTAAIRAAFDAVRGQSVSAGGVNNFTGDTVLFPPGVYRVTDPIVVAGTSRILGRGMPFIIMDDPQENIITTTDAWRMDIRGLQFRGGRVQLDLRNPNMNTGMIVIEGCRFHDSNGPAIDDHMTSTIVHIRNCHFLRGEQVLRARTDMVTLRESWIETRSGVRDKAAIENYTHLLLENICGVPLGGRNLRWIDNHNTVTVRRFRLGGEGGGGFTAVYNFAKPGKELTGSRILIEDSELWNQGNLLAPTAVYCVEVPNKIEIRSSNLAGIRPIMVAPGIDLETYFTGVDPNLLTFVSRDNIGVFRNEMPELLKHPVCPPEVTRSALSEEETARRLAAAVEHVKGLKIDDAAPRTFGEHVQKTDPADWADLSPGCVQWDLSDLMDGTKHANHRYLAKAVAGDDVVLMRRVSAEGTWPHVLIRDVKVDLDQTPWLTWRQKDVGIPKGYRSNPAGYAVRAVHRESGVGMLLTEMHWTPFFDYRAFNLKEEFDLDGGAHTFDIRFYYLGLNYLASDKCEYGREGDFTAIDFIRLERD